MIVVTGVVAVPDIYIKVKEASPQIPEGLMSALELRAADPQQRAMLNAHLTDAALPHGARLLEVGCGASWLANPDDVLARRAKISSVNAHAPGHG